MVYSLSVVISLLCYLLVVEEKNVAIMVLSSNKITFSNFITQIVQTSESER